MTQVSHTPAGAEELFTSIYEHRADNDAVDVVARMRGADAAATALLRLFEERVNADQVGSTADSLCDVPNFLGIEQGDPATLHGVVFRLKPPAHYEKNVLGKQEWVEAFERVNGNIGEAYSESHCLADNDREPERPAELHLWVYAKEQTYESVLALLRHHPCVVEMGLVTMIIVEEEVSVAA